MIRPRTLVGVALVFCLSSTAVRGQDRSRYRDFELGSSLASVLAKSGAAMTDTEVIHQRPALLQELEWRPRYYLSGSTASTGDPIRQIVFSFYNDQLSRIAVDYDPQRTEGLTDADMTEAISTMYGETSTLAANGAGPASQFELESGMLIAAWRDADHTVGLYRPTYGAFRLIVTSRRLDGLARTATAQALRLDQKEAPQRELARQKKEADDARAAADKARAGNKATFKP